MARKLKTYQTSLGFFDLAIAAPSMKAALAAWGADSNLFHQGAAKQTEDPDIVAATMASPGVVLKRPVGSGGPFKENAELPTDIGGERRQKTTAGKSAGHNTHKHPKRAVDPAAERKAALAFEREEKRRERERAKEEASQRSERERRKKAIAKAQGALDAASGRHEKEVADLQARIAALEEKVRAEKASWEKERARHEATLRQARK
jgi:hypothetical protein